MAVLDGCLQVPRECLALVAWNTTASVILAAAAAAGGQRRRGGGGGGGGDGGGGISGVGGVVCVSGVGVDDDDFDSCASGVRPPCCLSSSLRRVCPARRPFGTREPPLFRFSRPLSRKLTSAPGCTERPGGSCSVVRGVWYVWCVSLSLSLTYTHTHTTSLS